MTKRQSEIIEKSIKLIAEKGIQGFTIKNLSKEINVSEPAIYRHFDSKTEILLTMLKSLHEKTTELTEELLERNITFLRKLEETLFVYFKIFSEHPYWAAIVFSDEIFKNEKILSDTISEMLKRKEDSFLKLIASAQKEGSLRKDINKKHITIMLIGSIRLLVKRWQLENFSFDLKSEGKKLIRTLIKIISN